MYRRSLAIACASPLSAFFFYPAAGLRRTDSSVPGAPGDHGRDRRQPTCAQRHPRYEVILVVDAGP